MGPNFKREAEDQSSLRASHAYGNFHSNTKILKGVFAGQVIKP